MLLFFFFFLPQSLVTQADLQELTLNSLKEKAVELERLVADTDVTVITCALSSLWRRWSRLHGVARAQERALEDTAQEWRNITEKVRMISSRWAKLLLRNGKMREKKSLRSKILATSAHMEVEQVNIFFWIFSQAVAASPCKGVFIPIWVKQRQNRLLVCDVTPGSGPVVSNAYHAASLLNVNMSAVKNSHKAPRPKREMRSK